MGIVVEGGRIVVCIETEIGFGLDWSYSLNLRLLGIDSFYVLI